MHTRWIRRGAAAMAVAFLASAVPAPAQAASGGTSPLPWTMAGEIASPSANPALAYRQALGCTVVGLGVTGVAMASGALVSGGSAGVAAGAVAGEILTYFGAGCTIGAFLGGLFPVTQPVVAMEDVGG